MKLHTLLVICISILALHCLQTFASSAETTEMVQVKMTNNSPLDEVHPMKEFMTRSLARLWSWIQDKGKSENTVIGRCFGAARKLKIIMPMIVFKLGVIITTLAFLTIFSLKSIALLVLLLFINTSGLAAKLGSLVFFKQNHGEEPGKHWGHHQPHQQAVHFHIHQKKNGGFYHPGGHEGYSGDEGWYQRSLGTDYSDTFGASDDDNFSDVYHTSRSRSANINDRDLLAARLRLLNINKSDLYQR